VALWRLDYHLVWATKERLPLIQPELKPILYGHLFGKADSLQCIIHAIGGTEDHIHIVASIPPKLSVADFVKHLKGSSAHHLTQTLAGTSTAFGWQRGYGVLSLGSKQLPDARAYVGNQKTHHNQGSIIASLEAEKHEDDGPASMESRKIQKR
jgi:REP-associated tyrosine transposase